MGRRKGSRNVRGRTDPRPVLPATAAMLAGRIPAPEPAPAAWGRCVAAFKEALDPRLVSLLCSLESYAAAGEPPPEEERRRLQEAARVARKGGDCEFFRQLDRCAALGRPRGRFVTVWLAWQIASRREGAPPPIAAVKEWADRLGGPQAQANFSSRDIVNICERTLRLALLRH